MDISDPLSINRDPIMIIALLNILLIIIIVSVN